jgi:hypothetical protein
MEYIPLFIGAKGINISTDHGFTETISQNFSHLSTTDTYYNYQHEQARVGYIGDVSYFLQAGFVSFFTNKNSIELGR